MSNRPTLVLASEWGTSYTTGTGITGARLNVHGHDDTTPNAWGGVGITWPHPEYDGLMFACTGDAADFALSVGLLKVYVPRVRA